MIYKKTALFLLLLFSTQKLYPIEITIKLTYETFITTITSGAIITVYAIVIMMLPRIIKYILQKISHAVLTERYTLLGRLLIMLGQTSIVIEEANSMVQRYTWKGEKRETLEGEERGTLEEEKTRTLSPEELLLQKEKFGKKICNLLTFLLDIKMNPNCVYSYDYYSILKYACLYKDIELAEKSIAAGADPNHKQLNYIQRETCGGETDDMKSLEYCLDQGGSPLIIAFLKNDINMIQLLINHNAEPLYYKLFQKDPSTVLPPQGLIEKKCYNIFNNLLDWYIIDRLKKKDPTISPEYYTNLNSFDECIEEFVETYPDYIINNNECYKNMKPKKIKKALIKIKQALTESIKNNRKEILQARNQYPCLLELAG